MLYNDYPTNRSTRPGAREIAVTARERAKDQALLFASYQAERRRSKASRLSLTQILASLRIF